MADELQTNLAASVAYNAGEVLPLTLTITPPSDGKYYVMGALYDENLVLIIGTQFSLFLWGAVGEQVGVNSDSFVSIFELEEAEVREVSCQFQFQQSNATLGLILYKMSGEVAAPDFDTQIDEVVCSLIGSELPSEGFGGVIDFAIPIMMLGMVVVMFSGMTKD